MAPWLMLVVSTIYGYSAAEWAYKGDWAQFFMYFGYSIAGYALYFISVRLST
jgi:hypothetical protein